MDLKPSNIQVDDFGQVLVCDWGLARDLSDNDTLSEDLSTQEMVPKDLNLSYNNKIKGTPGYMAPEQISRRFGSRSQKTDVFCLGGLLYFLLTYEKPFNGSNLEELLKQTENGDLIAPNKRTKQHEIPLALDAVVLKAMKNKASERYPTVKQLSDDVRSFLQGFATSAEDAGFFKEIKLLIIRNKLPFILSAVALFGTLILTSFFIHQLRNEKHLAESAQAHAEAMANKSHESENRALKAQSEAENAETKALSLVQALQAEKKFSSSLKVQAAKELMDKAFVPFRKAKNYLSATETIRLVLQLNPRHQDALYHAALMELGAFQMTKTRDYIKQYKGPKDTQWIKQAYTDFLTPHGHSKKYTWEEQLQFTNSLLSGSFNADKHYIAWHINSSTRHKFSMDDCIQYAKSSMKRRNKSKQFNFNLQQLDDGSYQLSLNGTRCSPYEEIRHWKISELDMSYTNFRDLTILWTYPLKKLNIAHTPVNSLNKAWDIPVEELNIKGTKISDYEAIYQYPLKKLTINEFCSGIHRFNHMKTLRELTLPSGVYLQKELDKLNKKIKITYYDHGS
ncbi:serine/threonine-protein kinase [Lentisphaera araneosa HTCC2155]|uniref:Serine/threonine-protein kinase n=1 Tax=Lentisphaera araneosa HTCC2155 TaxID=313628 RepID=A6DKN1_9BACT|nr:serine/threonine-protein kinase [Lentisphaera araneosa HTCC2155]